MTLGKNGAAARKRWAGLALYDQFEHFVIIFLTALIAVVIIWNLALKIFWSLVVAGSFDPTDYEVFQAVFGMILR
jgi:hypothetical protein